MTGEGDSEANAPLHDRLLLTTSLRGADKDEAAMEAAVGSSGLHWVAHRPATLSDDPAKGDVRVINAETARKIARADLAASMVAQLAPDEHLHRAITIANDQGCSRLRRRRRRSRPRCQIHRGMAARSAALSRRSRP